MDPELGVDKRRERLLPLASGFTVLIIVLSFLSFVEYFMPLNEKIVEMKIELI